MQIKLIKKNTSTGRVEFYDPANVLLGSVPATSPMRVGNNTVDFDSVGGRVFSVGYNVDFTTTQIDAGAITPAPATFALFLALLQTSFFNATNAGGSGGGGGGDATLAEQQEQTAKLLAIETATGLIATAPVVNPAEPNASLTQLARGQLQRTNTLVGQTLGIGSASDALELNPSNNATLVSVSKGLLYIESEINAAIGTGGSPTVLDPDLGGSAIGVLKGLLSVAGLSIGQKIDLGLFPGVSIVHKSGKNFDIDTATLPESVWNGGGFYTGFPLTHTTTAQVVSSSALDIGTLTVLCLETDTSTEYTTQTIAVNGTTPVNSTFNVYRIHSASYASTANVGTQLNAGTITVRSTANPLTVFIAMPIGRNQSYISGYTIPFGRRGYVMGTKWRVGGAAGNFIEGAMFIRPKNGAPRDRRNCTVAFGAPATDEYDGFIIAEAGTDIMPVITTVNANNVLAEASYDIILLPA